eukprot:scaffold2044_cov202-Prasinococcus_capsulatus_cf.AAC.3
MCAGCPDYTDFCLVPAPGSCEDSCGASPDGICFCDELCTLYIDCCDDYEEECEGAAPSPPPPPSPPPSPPPPPDVQIYFDDALPFPSFPGGEFVGGPAWQIRYTADVEWFGFQMNYVGPIPTASSNTGVDGTLGYAVDLGANGILLGYSAINTPMPAGSDLLLVEFYYDDAASVGTQSATISGFLASGFEGAELVGLIVVDTVVFGGGPGCPNAGGGDVNVDEETNVLDVVLVVNVIIGVTDVMELKECGFEGGDLNTDGNLDVLDVVGIVNIITS